jgi:hypothetical protein
VQPYAAPHGTGLATGLAGSPSKRHVALSKAQRAYILARVERLQTLVEQLEKAPKDGVQRTHVQALIRRELNAAKKAVRRLPAHDPT